MTTETAPRRRAWSGRRIALLGLRIALVAAVGAVAVWKLDLGELHDAFRVRSWAFLAAAVAANCVSVGFKGLAWKWVVDALPAVTRRVRYRDVIPPLFIGYLFNAVLAARVGEIVKVMLLRRRLQRRGQRPYTTTLLGSVVAENLVATIVWVGVVVSIGLFLPLPSYAWIAAAVLGVGCLTIVVVALLSSPGRQIPPWLNTGPLWARARRAVSRLWGAVRESHLGLRAPRQMTAVVGASLAGRLAQWAAIYLALLAFGLGRVGWGGAGLLLVTITLAQTFPVLPGNVVVYQAAAVVPLTASYGVGAAEAIAFSVVLQATEAVVGVAIGFMFLVAEGVDFGQLRRQAEAEAEGARSRDGEPADTLAGP